ncbi:MAG TPA: transglutaminase family protein [Candidatus Didemnitutus sp.]|jgi:transglutaminase-like putative cysteine protease
MFDVTIRVGCHLIYEVQGTACIVLQVEPGPGPGHAIVAEDMLLGNCWPGESFVDRHGNRLRRVNLGAGTYQFRHDAIIAATSQPDNHGFPPSIPLTPAEMPVDELRYTLPSRYCDSDKLGQFAWEKFGTIEHGLPRVQAISEWLHRNIEYRFGSGRPDLSAWDVLQRGYGVCRDFAHLAVALNRTFNLPARYVTGHLPDIGFDDPGTPMDFHAYAEVNVGGHWFTTDPRFHVPRVGRIKISNGLDAVDCAFGTVYGAARLSHFEAWAYQVPHGAVALGSPIDLSRRLDGTAQVRTESPYAAG